MQFPLQPISSFRADSLQTFVSILKLLYRCLPLVYSKKACTISSFYISKQKPEAVSCNWNVCRPAMFSVEWSANNILLSLELTRIPWLSFKRSARQNAREKEENCKTLEKIPERSSRNEPQKKMQVKNFSNLNNTRNPVVQNNGRMNSEFIDGVAVLVHPIINF